MSVWSLAYDGFDPAQQGLREALCTLGNGYFATRGAAPEARADGVNYPGTYVAGLYNRLTSSIAGRTIENEDMVNVPNWLPLEFRPEGGSWFDPRDVELLEHRQELDLRSGVLARHLRWRDQQGRVTRVEQRRFVHMDKPHLAGLETTFVAENWSGTLQVRSGLDGGVTNSGVQRYRTLANRHLEVLAAEVSDDEVVELEAQTTQSHVRIAEAARTRVVRAGGPAPLGREHRSTDGYVGLELTVELRPEEPVIVEKIVALYTSRDRAISEARLEARTAVQRAGAFDELLLGHARAWDRIWNRYGIAIAGNNNRPQLVLNLHIFHLLQTVSPNTIDLDVGVPARGLHGEAYRGHIFWDELFIFPFLNFESPTLTRSLLAYRYRRLDAARWLARDDGHEGACYPWQSGSDGREETQRVHLNPRSGRWLPDNSHLQRHVNIAIAYNVWQHYQVTGSIEFLRFQGAEMLVEIARFLASLSSYNPALDRYEIRGVMGPDEYHDAYPGSDRPGLDNNAYTNVMTVWVLLRALETLEILPPHYRREVVDELGLADIELDRWRDISTKMRVPFHQDGVISQFEGYEQLEEFDWDGYRQRYGSVQRLDRILEAEGDTTNRYKVSKQADVLMLLYLLSEDELRELLGRLGYELAPDAISRTIAYYLARTSHGSTLSGVVDAWVLARSERERAWKFLLEALESDVSDVQGGTTAEGVHLGAMAGTVDLVQRAFSGMQARGDVLWFDPALPIELPELRFSAHYRGHRVDVTISAERFRVAARPGPGRPIKLGLRDKVIDLEPGGTVELKNMKVEPPPEDSRATVRPRAAMRPAAGARRLSTPLERTALCLDFDGTLAPIVSDPDAARPLDGTVELLGRLAARLAAVALVSGRPAAFLAAHAAAPGVLLLGLYGLEEARDGQVKVAPELTAAQPAVRAALADLQAAPAVRDSGAYLEDKGSAIGVHLRRVAEPERWAEPIDATVREIAGRHGLEVLPGRLVWELRPPVRRDKGDAVRQVVADSGAGAVVVAGDDRGDLPAFDAVAELASHPGMEGLRIAVRSAEAPPELLAHADLVVDGPEGLRAYLEGLLE